MKQMIFMICVGLFAVGIGIFTIVGAVTMYDPRESHVPAVGDSFVHLNPGNSGLTSETPRPFIKLSTVKAIENGRMTVEYYFLHTDGGMSGPHTNQEALNHFRYAHKIE